MVSEAAADEVFLVTRLDPVEEEPFCTVAFFLLPTSSGPHQMRSPWAAAHGREHGRCRPSTVCLFSAALCWLCWTRSRYVIRSASCLQMSMQAPHAVLYSSASAPRFRDTFGTASARLQQLPRGFRAFPDLFRVTAWCCLQCLGTFRALSGRFCEVSGHGPRCRGFRDNAQKVPKVSERCGCRDNVQTTTPTRCRRCVEVDFHVQILVWTKISTRKLFDVRNVRKYPEGFRNDKDSVWRVPYWKYADRLRIFNFYFLRVVHALVDARSNRRTNQWTDELTSHEHYASGQSRQYMFVDSCVCVSLWYWAHSVCNS